MEVNSSSGLNSKFVEVEGKSVCIFPRGKVQISNNLRTLTFILGTNFPGNDRRNCNFK